MNNSKWRLFLDYGPIQCKYSSYCLWSWCVPIIAHHHHPCIAMVTGIVSFVLRRMRREREPGKSCRRRLEKQHSPEWPVGGGGGGYEEGAAEGEHVLASFPGIHIPPVVILPVWEWGSHDVNAMWWAYTHVHKLTISLSSSDSIINGTLSCFLGLPLLFLLWGRGKWTTSQWAEFRTQKNLKPCKQPHFSKKDPPF